MLAKKGLIGMPVLFWPSMLLLLIILVFYSFIFFGLGAVKSPDLTVKPTSYYDSGKLIVILSSPVGDSGKTISDVLAYNPNEEEINLIKKEVKALLSQLDKPKNKSAFWNFVVSANEKEIASIRESTFGSKNYLEQTVYIPTKDKSIIKVTLFLNCFGCSEEDLASV